jgi:hypothetical protein
MMMIMADAVCSTSLDKIAVYIESDAGLTQAETLREELTKQRLMMPQGAGSTVLVVLRTFWPTT